MAVLPDPTPRNAAAVVVAGGKGSRSGLDVPKQYASLGRVAVLRRTLDALAANSRIDRILVVIGSDDEGAYSASTQGVPKLLPPAFGGATRQVSVLNGLEALAPGDPVLVLVHDAARPFVSAAVIGRVIDACGDRNGAIPVLPASETLKRLQDGVVTGTVPRDDLAFAQTPQGFPFRLLLDAHRRAAQAGRTDLTDDEAVAALAGLPVLAVDGDPRNVKLTRAEDFVLAERMLAARSARETRTAQGFDVHAFGPGQSVWLGGVEIAHDQGLVGHSDADVALHALTDALLGTIAEGDIGQHFPPSDPQWKGAASDRFLRDATRRVGAAGGRILHLDLTLICERPKIGPHRDAMQAAIAAMVGIATGRVSVKATTSERLGFTGRGEGIAALALATVELPRGNGE